MREGREPQLVRAVTRVSPFTLPGHPQKSGHRPIRARAAIDCPRSEIVNRLRADGATVVTTEAAVTNDSGDETAAEMPLYCHLRDPEASSR